MLTVNSGAGANSSGTKATAGAAVRQYTPAGALSIIAAFEEDAPGSRGIIRKSNMNLKNIGSCMEGKDEEGALSDGKAAKKDMPHASRRKKTFNGNLMRI